MIFKPVKATDWDPSLKKSLKLLNMSTVFTVVHLLQLVLLPPFEFMTSSLLWCRGLMIGGAGGEETSQ